MITQKQAINIAESIMEELAERSMTGEKEGYIDIKITDVGQLVEMMLVPVTQLEKQKQSHKEEDPWHLNGPWRKGTKVKEEL